MLIHLIPWFCFILTDNISAAINSNRADNGHPCLIPRFRLNYSESYPLMETQLSIYVTIQRGYLFLELFTQTHFT